jgi:leucyl aminopeptidase
MAGRPVNRADKAVPLTPLHADALAAWLAKAPKPAANWVETLGFKAKPGTHALLPSADGRLERVLVGVRKGPDIWSYGGLASALPEGAYRLDPDLGARPADAAALGWSLGAYAFTRYKKPRRGFARLLWPEACDRAHIERTQRAVFLVRDLVNTPAGDMGPAELADAAKTIAKEFGAEIKIIVGDALLKANYPLVHAVGRASSRPPRLIDLRWGRRGPKVTLVGKGVCFDSGGLDIKQSHGMKMMKKDMGGGAHVLALAQMIMGARLRVRLRVLVPAVENAIAGNAVRPLDIVRSRKGITVEIGNTDAEGRLILCDALAEADSEAPDLLIDCATLTGAARVALGPDLPALFCNNDRLANHLLTLARDVDDPLWRLPLHRPYRRGLDTAIADISSTGEGIKAGAVAAALYLQEFVGDKTKWAHLDMMAWNAKNRPGRPEGGEATGLRALYALVADVAQGKSEGHSKKRRPAP